jgi:flagellar motility protein MotE (MotC chaperone)
MKSAYELAMERLEKQSPSAPVSDELRAALAEIDSTYKAKIAEREVFLQSQIQKSLATGDVTEADSIRLQLSRELRRLQEECEAKKAKLR